MKITRFTSVAALGAAAAIALAGCAANEGGSSSSAEGTESGSTLEGTLNASGASSQVAAQEAWVAGFQTANEGVTVNYESTGSGTGRENFIAGASNFIGSDRAFNDEEVAAGGFGACASDAIVEVPMYISPVAVAFNLEGVDTLNLDPETIAGIFAGEITNWNDEAIASANPDAELPDQAITPVHRADDSGTTETFVTYLQATAPDIWDFEISGEWPLDSGEAAQQTSGVAQALSGGVGTIGYLDASQIPEGTGQVHVGVDGEYVEYSSDAAAALVENSALVEGRGEGDLVFDVDPAAATGGAYPIALVSYAIACEEYEDENVGALVKAYFEYMASAEGQDAAAENAGNAPISDSLREQVLGAIDTIQAG
ncbi:phosphate ABC transporter substrate-binding protein PstS [Microbacterium halophytorum]|uniref:phosphate ABC transporter substrate-binding protein PstS n=1 Tax=Microbacterium halophytorum TaxID=2067568 RepID=UPI000CFC5FB2|nr:phosphate ABC transporter substrate-binding protein PstS [Microbacterium halophytorum]